MPRGQKPKPAAVKIAEGNRRKVGAARLKPDIVGKGLPQPPAHLKPEERRLWLEVLRSLPKGVLSRADVAVLERFVVAWNRFRQCDKRIKDEGLTISTPQGQIKHPLMASIIALGKEMHMSGSDLGLSPVARARLSQATDTDQDPMGWLMGDNDDVR